MTHLLASENRVVDHDTIDSGIFIGFIDLLFKVLLVDLSKLKFHTCFGTCLCSPLGILYSSGILVSEKTH
jgi:hypothetical protein